MKLIKEEYADLHLLYGEVRGNSRAVRRHTASIFLKQSLPLYILLWSLCEAGSDWFLYDGDPDPQVNPFGF
jgi:hypothetical protein